MQGRNVSILLVALLLLGGLLAVALSTDFTLFQPSLGGDSISVRSVMYLGTVPIDAEIADSEEERVRGLSGRESLPPGKGLLFVFPQAGKYGIWMQGMRFPIDVFWIGTDDTVVWVEEQVVPESYPAVFDPPEDARYILETNAGVAEAFGIKTGSRVILPPNIGS